MPQAYCTGCQGTVEVATDGVCTSGHLIRRPRREQRRHRATAAARPPKRRRTPRPSPQPTDLAASPFERLPFVDLFGFDESSNLLPIESAEAVPPAPAVAPRVPEPPLITRPPSMFEMLPRLADIERQKPNENTGTLVERLWEATSEIDTLGPAWTPDLRLRIDGAKHRWWILVLVVVALVAFAAAGTRTRDRLAQPTDLTPHRLAVAEAQARVDDARMITDQLADPATGGQALSDAAVTLTAIDSTARQLATSGLALADEAPEASAAFVAAADLGTSTEQRLGDALTYRLVFAQGFRLPDLPDELDAIAISDLGFELSAMLADTGRVLDRLPRDPSLDSHRQRAFEAHEDLDGLIVDYLQALRDGETLLAGAYAGAIGTTVSELHAGLDTALEAVSGELGMAIDAYEAALAQAGAELSSGS